MIANFGESTSTSTFRRHLTDHHVNDWVTCCARLKIKITAGAAKKALAALKLGDQSSGTTEVRQPYSKEGFVDALVEFIIADDQVSNLLLRQSTYQQTTLAIEHRVLATATQSFFNAARGTGGVRYPRSYDNS
jgi:hypothetical protein